MLHDVLLTRCAYNQYINTEGNIQDIMEMHTPIAYSYSSTAITNFSIETEKEKKEIHNATIDDDCEFNIVTGNYRRYFFLRRKVLTRYSYGWINIESKKKKIVKNLRNNIVHAARRGNTNLIRSNLRCVIRSSRCRIACDAAKRKLDLDCVIISYVCNS